MASNKSQQVVSTSWFVVADGKATTPLGKGICLTEGHFVDELESYHSVSFSHALADLPLLQLSNDNLQIIIK